MRIVALIYLLLFLFGCNQTPITAEIPKESCDDVGAKISPVKGLKPSKHLEVVEHLACHYGRLVARVGYDCTLEVHAPEYFGHHGDTTYGLKNATVTALLESELRGREIADDFWEQLQKLGPGEHDETACLNGIGEFSEQFQDLVEATRSLSRDGY